MKDKLFVDTDVILDIALMRKPHFKSSAYLFSLIESRSIIGYTSSVIISNLYYIIRKIDSHKSALEFIAKLCLILKILSVDEDIVGQALTSNFNDFEDAIQYYCALSNKANYLVTRNIKDYANCTNEGPHTRRIFKYNKYF